ncbi:peptidase [Microlunatus endophyticus]|uniref:Peptidase n=1 Tax=Microlunatus endophyticus TaxID=1716077 RepID=A0A917SEY9_9ACTN|nr:membrane dipeptidase [Microlunatus endophyticus]GGL73708.1 peptidase [Microlunatus endophyticus]
MNLKSSMSYEGYTAYSYLRAGEDYQDFERVAEIARVPVYHDESLSDLQRQRAKQLIDQSIVISLHDHVQVSPADISQQPGYLRQGRGFTGYEGLARSGMTAVFDNGVFSAPFSSANGWRLDDTVHDLGMRLCDIDHQNFIIPGKTTEDIRRAHANGQLAMFSGLEAATVIGNELDRLEVLFGLGVRMMGVAYSNSNQLGCGLGERLDSGLTMFGEAAIRRMNRVGMVIDVSHSGDRTALETINLSSAPVVMSHCGSREVWPSARMKPDAIIQECASRGGMIGIEAAPHSTPSTQHPRHCLDSAMDHFEHLVDVVGIDHVGFGPDTLFGDHAGFHRRGGSSSTSGQLQGDYPRVDYVDGLENPGENFWNIAGWLVSHGYSDDEIRKVIGGNVLTVLDAIWA